MPRHPDHKPEPAKEPTTSTAPITADVLVHRARSLDEMQAALNALVVSNIQGNIPPHYDTPQLILADAIAEVIELRTLHERMRVSALEWIDQFKRK